MFFALVHERSLYHRTIPEPFMLYNSPPICLGRCHVTHFGASTLLQLSSMLFRDALWISTILYGLHIVKFHNSTTATLHLHYKKWPMISAQALLEWSSTFCNSVRKAEEPRSALVHIHVIETHVSFPRPTRMPVLQAVPEGPCNPIHETGRLRIIDAKYFLQYKSSRHCFSTESFFCAACFHIFQNR